MLLIFHLCDAVTSWRHVMTLLNLIYLHHLVDVLESWLFLFSWFFRSLSSKMLLIFHSCDALTSWRHVMTSCHDVIKLDSPISACWCARKLILFCFHVFCRSLSSEMLMFFNYFDVLVSWRYVMTSQKLFHLSQVMDLLERWSCSWFHDFSGCIFRKC